MSKLGNAYSVSLAISTSVYPGLIAFTHHSIQQTLSTNTETSRSILVAGRSSKNKIWREKVRREVHVVQLRYLATGYGQLKVVPQFLILFDSIFVRLWENNPTKHFPLTT